MAGSKGKSKGGSGSANDKRGGIAKAKDAAAKRGGDTAGSAETRGAVKGETRSGGGESRGGGKSGRG
jgi:hypothetical protein